MMRSPISVADAHAHLRNGASFGYKVEAEQMLAVMDSLNMEFIAVTASLACRNEMQRGNDQVAEVLQLYPSRFRGYITANPNVPDEAVRELERCSSFHNPPLIKLHPGTHQYPVHGPKYAPIWDYANQTRAIVLVHTWESHAFCGPQLFPAIGRTYPHARILLGHSGVTWKGYEQAMEAAATTPNLYLELCGSQRHRTIIERCVQRLGGERILYGSDMPFLEPASTMADVLTAAIPDHEKESILRYNFLRLLEEA